MSAKQPTPVARALTGGAWHNLKNFDVMSAVEGTLYQGGRA